MASKGRVIGFITVTALVVSGLILYAQKKQEWEAEEARIEADRRMKAKVGEINDLLKAGRFWEAGNSLPDYLPRNDSWYSYISKEKIESIKSLKGVALWSALSDGQNLDAHTFSVDFFDFMFQFKTKNSPQLSEREQKLKEFGQLSLKEPEPTFDVAGMAAWFTENTGVDILKTQFLMDDKLELAPADYDVDYERWVLKKSYHALTRVAFDATKITKGESYVGQNAFGMTKVIEKEYESPDQFSVVNVGDVRKKLGDPIVIPMPYDDAKCQSMHIYYRILPVATELGYDMRYENKKKATMSDPKEVQTFASRGIPVRINEMQIFCRNTKKKLWSATF